MKIFTLKFLLIFLLFPQAYSQDYQGVNGNKSTNPELSSFLRGLQFYKNQKYQDSFDQFLLAYKQDQQNPKILFNLGLSAMNSDKLGYTIGAWRKAQFVSPLFFQAHDALKKLNDHNPKALKMMPWMDKYFLSYVPAEIIFVLHGLVLVFFGFLLLKIRKIRRQALKENVDFSFQPFLTKTLAGSCLFILLSVFTGFKLYSITQKKASLLSQQPLYVTPDPNATFVNDVPEGDIVKIEKQQNQWSQIKTSKGAIGWVPNQNLFVISGWEIW